MSRLWSEDEDRVIRWARRRGIARMVIGRHIDRTAEAIRERERRLGLLPVRIPGEATEYRARFIWNGGFEVACEDAPRCVADDWNCRSDRARSREAVS